MSEKLELRISGGVATLLGLFVLFPYFLPEGMLRQHLHENPALVGPLGMASLLLGGYAFGYAHCMSKKR